MIEIAAICAHHAPSIDEISNFQVANRIEIFNAIIKRKPYLAALYCVQLVPLVTIFTLHTELVLLI